MSFVGCGFGRKKCQCHSKDAIEEVKMVAISQDLGIYFLVSDNSFLYVDHH